MNSVRFASIKGDSVSVDRSAVEELRGGLRGDVLLNEDTGYDVSRKVWNGMIDRNPGLIVRCQGAPDIIRTLQFARNHSVLTAIRGGGHNVAGNAVCEGGIVIDLSRMRSAFVNAKSKTARVDGGCLLGDVDAATQLHGLAVSGGIVSHTGIAGLTLGGGFGWISRKFGLSVDNLISAEVITADGNLLNASKDENSDLFWGIRGGGGNFGVASSFEFRCADIGKSVFAGIIVHPFDEARKYIELHRSYVRDLPDEMTVWMVIRKAPPLPFLPVEVHGEMVVIVPFVFVGDEEKGKALMKPLREASKIHGEVMGMMPWTAWQSGFDALNSHGARNYWKSHHLNGLADGFIDKLIDFASKMPSPHCEFFIAHMEGAPARIAESETAYAFRKPPFLVNVHTRWENPGDDSRCIAWAREFFESTKPFAHGVYVNFISEEGQERVKDAYSPETWSKLVQLKKKYDPSNFFRMNQNIPV